MAAEYFAVDVDLTVAQRVRQTKSAPRRHAGIERHGDYATETARGGFIIHGRSDAALNPQGVRIRTVDIYSVVEALPGVAEALAVDQGFGDGPRILRFVKMRPGHRLDEAMGRRIKRKLRDEASPRHAPAITMEAYASGETRCVGGSRRPSRPAGGNHEALVNPGALDFFVQLSTAINSRFSCA